MGVLSLRRALAKPHPRVAAVDDGAFGRSDRRAPIAAVVVSLPAYVEAVGVGSVRVDGRDATVRITRLVRAIAPPEGLRALLLDGAVVGGFNVVDLDALSRALGVPVVAVTRDRPEFPRIRAALETWFPSTAALRLRLLRRHRLVRLAPDAGALWASAVGCDRRTAALLVRRSLVRGRWPEPLRLAHLVASAPAAAARRPHRTLKGARPRSGAGPVA